MPMVAAARLMAASMNTLRVSIPRTAARVACRGMVTASTVVTLPTRSSDRDVLAPKRDGGFLTVGSGDRGRGLCWQAGRLNRAAEIDNNDHPKDLGRIPHCRLRGSREGFMLASWQA